MPITLAASPMIPNIKAQYKSFICHYERAQYASAAIKRVKQPDTFDDHAPLETPTILQIDAHREIARLDKLYSPAQMCCGGFAACGFINFPIIHDKSCKICRILVLLFPAKAGFESKALVLPCKQIDIGDSKR